jgi:hypothetical protein
LRHFAVRPAGSCHGVSGQNTDLHRTSPPAHGYVGGDDTEVRCLRIADVQQVLEVSPASEAKGLAVLRMACALSDLAARRGTVSQPLCVRIGEGWRIAGSGMRSRLLPACAEAGTRLGEGDPCGGKAGSAGQAVLAFTGPAHASSDTGTESALLWQKARVPPTTATCRPAESAGRRQSAAVPSGSFAWFSPGARRRPKLRGCPSLLRNGRRGW